MSNNTLILSAIENTVNEKGTDHFRRPAGSYLTDVDMSNGIEVVGFLVDILRQVEAEDVTDKVEALGACRYYRVKSDMISGMESVSLLEDLTDDELAQVRIQKAHHQGSDGRRRVEIILPNLPPRPTDIIHLLVADLSSWPPKNSPTNETARLVTWFPGRMTPPVDVSRATVKRA
jgi:hypothetical protein